MLYVSAVGWVIASTGHLSSVISGEGHPWEIAKEVIIILTISFVYQGALRPEMRSDLRTRASVNYMYFERLLLPFTRSSKGDWSTSNMMTAHWHRFLIILFGVAVVLYLMAWRRQHQWVSSVTLGGTAIEPMVLTIPLTGPVYQSIGDEATEGAIRLV